MVGIDLEELKTKINKLDDLNESFSKNSKKIVETLNNLKKCYDSTTGVSYLFKDNVDNDYMLKKMKSMFLSYSDVLSSVKLSYVKQEKIFGDQINYLVSKI